MQDRAHESETRRNARRPLPEEPVPVQPDGPADAVLELQRTAGNHAVAGLLGAPAAGGRIQRLTVKASDLDAHIGIGSASVFGLGQSSFAAIRKTLSEYEKTRAGKRPDSAGDLMGLLDMLDAQVATWINTHRGSGKEEAARRAVLRKLEQEVAEERKRLSQQMEQQIYIEGLAMGARPVRGAEVAVAEDPADPKQRGRKFQAATGGARVAGAQAFDEFAQDIELAKREEKFQGTSDARRLKIEARMALVKEKGLTAGEHAAIMAFTSESGDFDYINPGMAGIDPWLAANKAAAVKKGAHGWGKLDDAVLKEEADLHTRMAVSGMKKLDPYKGLSYRGETKSEADARTVAAVGSTYKQHSLVSTSKNMDIAYGFAATNLSPSRGVAVFYVFEHSGAEGYGADVEMLSAMTGEGEVLLFPDAPFAVTSVVEVAPGGQAPGGPAAGFYAYILDRRRKGELPSARKCVLVFATAAKVRTLKGTGNAAGAAGGARSVA